MKAQEIITLDKLIETLQAVRAETPGNTPVVLRHHQHGLPMPISAVGVNELTTVDLRRDGISDRFCEEGESGTPVVFIEEPAIVPVGWFHKTCAPRG